MLVLNMVLAWGLVYYLVMCSGGKMIDEEILSNLFLGRFNLNFVVWGG